MPCFGFAHLHSHSLVCSFTDRFLWIHCVPNCGPSPGTHYATVAPARAQRGTAHPHLLCHGAYRIAEVRAKLESGAWQRVASQERIWPGS